MLDIKLSWINVQNKSLNNFVKIYKFQPQKS